MLSSLLQAVSKKQAIPGGRSRLFHYRQFYRPEHFQSITGFTNTDKVEHAGTKQVCFHAASPTAFARESLAASV
jgi:hypothetical protein